jgi:molybdenum cofactor biosynthesis enzyme
MNSLVGDQICTSKETGMVDEVVGRGRRRVQYGGVKVKAKVQCIGPTGVEMEALTAVIGAALSMLPDAITLSSHRITNAHRSDGGT